MGSFRLVNIKSKTSGKAINFGISTPFSNGKFSNSVVGLLWREEDAWQETFLDP